MSVYQLPAEHALHHDKSQADAVIDEIYEQADTLYERIKKERQYALKCRVKDAIESGGSDRVRKAKKSVDNQASTQAGRRKQKFIIEKFSEVVRESIRQNCHLREETFHLSAQKSRLEASNRIQSREIELLRKMVVPDAQCIPAHTQRISWLHDLREHPIRTSHVEHSTPYMSTSMEQNFARMNDIHELKISESELNTVANSEILPYVDTEAVLDLENDKNVTNPWDYLDLSSNQSTNVRAQMRNDNPNDMFPRGA